MARANKRVWIAIGVWLLAIAAAAALDRAVAEQAQAWETDSFLRSHHIFREAVKAPGTYYFTILLAIVIAFIHSKRWRAGVMLLVATATSVMNEVVKFLAGRARPFKSLGGDELATLMPFNIQPIATFSSKNLCFPSGHATLAFATAAALGILFPRWRWLFYALAAIVAAERVLENAHWLSDVVAAAALGIGGVAVVRKFLWDRRASNKIQ